MIAFILLSSLGFMSADIYLTALPLIAKSLKTTNAYAQYTLTLYFLGLAVAQILYALLAERYGISKFIYIGLLIYIFSSIFCFFSGHIEQLIFFRFIQAIGACSGMVLGRVIITTLYDIKKSAKVFTIVYSFVGMSPAIMPILGAQITKFSDWRTNFLFLSILGAITLLMYLIFVPKLPKMTNHHKLIDQIKGFRALNYMFFLATALICLADSAYFSYVLKAPFIFYDHGCSANMISLFFLFTAISYFVGNGVCRKLLSNRSVIYVLNIGMSIFFMATLFLFLAKTIFNINTPWIYVVSLSTLTFSNGFIISLCTSIGVNTNVGSKNISSGFLGFLQFVTISMAMFIANNLSYNYLPALLFLMGIAMLICSHSLNTKIRQEEIFPYAL